MQQQGVGINQPQWKLNYITRYAGVYSATYIANRIDVSLPFVYDFCKANGLPLNKRTYTVDKAKRFSENKPIKLVRPPAVYDNKSWEETIHELLMMKVV